MSIILSLILSAVGFYLLYLISAKQIEKTRRSSVAIIAKYAKGFKLLAFVLFLLGGSLLILRYGSSIGFVSWWLFVTPICLGIILYSNDLRPKNKKLK